MLRRAALRVGDLRPLEPRSLTISDPSARTRASSASVLPTLTLCSVLLATVALPLVRWTSPANRDAKPSGLPLDPADAPRPIEIPLVGPAEQTAQSAAPRPVQPLPSGTGTDLVETKAPPAVKPLVSPQAPVARIEPPVQPVQPPSFGAAAQRSTPEETPSFAAVQQPTPSQEVRTHSPIAAAPPTRPLVPETVTPVPPSTAAVLGPGPVQQAWSPPAQVPQVRRSTLRPVVELPRPVSRLREANPRDTEQTSSVTSLPKPRHPRIDTPAVVRTLARRSSRRAPAAPAASWTLPSSLAPTD